ncbi:TrkH family potassium uptake protein [Carnobacterium funditum]|uniref:TrkH family potassium uptake protein n=1 Tax=Carnobacterium funditum TaxID=2752 RepID=UPI000552D670|nr:potassium transporter TrkG [Carnobacterium funditum]
MLSDKFRKLSISTRIAFSFALVIFIGSLLLSLPISTAATSQNTYFDNLFTAVSLTSVTGLATTSVAESYTIFGQVISIILMQIGGLGLMTIIATILIRFGKKISYTDAMAVKEALNRDKLGDFKTYVLSIFKYTLVIEGVGMFLLSFRFVPDFGWAKGLFTSLFLAVSGFCNAGFDNMGAVSLQNYVQDPLVNFVIATLIILGGIGFSVWFDVTSNMYSVIKNKKKLGFKKMYRLLRPHTRLAVNVSSILLLTGTIMFMAVEWNNTSSIGNYTIPQKVMVSFFQSVTMRTAGFATIDYATVLPFSLLFSIFLMFIGGSPGGTAGGIKTTTFALVILLVINEIRGQNSINYASHSIPVETIRRAIVVVFTFFACLMTGFSILLIVEEQSFIMLLFEAVSALGTVGISANLTPELSRIGQTVLMVFMFIGRIGPITIFLSLVRRKRKGKGKERVYAKTNILIG